MRSLLACCLLILLSCEAPEGDAGKDPGDSNTSSDSDSKADSNDTGWTCPGVSEFFCDASWFHAFSVPVDQGLRWELDESWFLNDASVPSFMALHENAGFILVYTRMDQWGARWAARSTDGLEWTPDKEVMIPQGFGAGGDCIQWSTDISSLYLDDGSYRLVVEAYDQREMHYSHCVADSVDALTWTPGPEAYEMPPEDEGTSSVWSVTRSPQDGYWYAWYNGDLLGENTIRVARSTDGATFEPFELDGILPAGLVDSDVVLTEGGGYRLYLVDQAADVIALADGSDERSFEDPIAIEGLASEGCSASACPSICLRDPAYLRLPDGSMWLYLGYSEVSKECLLTRRGLVRARAVDGVR